MNPRSYAIEHLDPYYRTDWRYQVLDVLVRLTGGSNTSKVLAIFLIALIAKLITTPFSVAQFRSMRAMQLFQPELKKLQEKYKDDKQALAKAQMDLMKEHNINPASSCLPMLVQLVILWQVYYAIRHYLYQFSGVHFLYLKSLANPDTISMHGSPFPGPILVLYAGQHVLHAETHQHARGQPGTAAATAHDGRHDAVPDAHVHVQLPGRLRALLVPSKRPHDRASVPHHPSPPGSRCRGRRPRAAKERPEILSARPPAPPEALERLSQGRKPPKKKKKRRY